MIGGYSFLDGIFKRGKKESFLKEKINGQESIIYDGLKYSLHMFMATNLIFLLISLFKGIIPNFVWYSVGATVLNAVVRQWYRKYLLAKYRYESKKSTVGNLIFVATTIIGVLVALYGLLNLFLYISRI